MDLALAVRTSIALLACSLSAPALASYGTEDQPEHELWVTSGFLSHHTQNSNRYNQHNDGLGVEWRWTADWQFNAGHYRNSVRHGSTYAQMGWTPLQTALPLDLRLRAGASVGVINGYSRVRDGGYFATLVPMVTVETGRIGLNLVYVPTIGKRVDGAFALQLKLHVN